MSTIAPFRFAIGLITALLLATPGSNSFAQDGDSGRWVDTGTKSTKTRGVDLNRGGYYSDRERGYYWYEEDPDRRQPPTPEELVAAPPAASTQHEPLSVRWLQEKLEESRIAAIDNPTRENVELYVYLQKISMDKAEKFAIMSQQVAMINPDLDESYDNPTTTFARRARMNAQGGEQKRVLDELAQRVGVYYFFRSDCEYCAKQNMTLQALARDHGYNIMPISIDHRPLEDGSFPDWVPDRGQAKTLGVTVTPTLYLFHPPNEVAFLAAGLQTEGQLTKRILQVSEANGWLSKDEMERAMRGLPRDFLVDAVKDLGEVDWTDSQSALEALRYASRRGVEKARLNDVLTGSNPEPGIQGTKINR